MYATIKENLSVIINGKHDYWPPQKVENIADLWSRYKVKRRYLKTSFKVVSPIFKRRRLRLVGHLENGYGEKILLTVLAWADDLEILDLNGNPERKVDNPTQEAPDV